MSDSTADSGCMRRTHEHAHPPYQRHHFAPAWSSRWIPPALRMWLFLLTEIMFFGGLFTAYLIYRNWYYPAFVAASHQLNIFWGSLNTLLLITSSFTMAMGVWCAETRRKSGLVLCLVLTFILGLGFLGHQDDRVQGEVGEASRSRVRLQPAVVCASDGLKSCKDRGQAAGARIWRGRRRFTSRCTLR